MAAKPVPDDFIFVDTTICIARLFAAPSQRQRIAATCHQRTVCTGLVCRQEFKRRVLGDAAYLWQLLSKRNSFEETHHYLNGLRGNQFHKRRAGICLDLMGDVTGSDDKEKTDRLRTKLCTLLVTGLTNFDSWIDIPTTRSNCGCAKLDVRSSGRGKNAVYDVGPKECGELIGEKCGIASFLSEVADQRAKVLAYLQSLPLTDKSQELADAQSFLEKLTADTSSATDDNPCLEIGDLVIALEAAAIGTHTFYTTNWEESRHLCKALEQTLVIRPVDGFKDDAVYSSGDSEWRRLH